MPSQSSPPVALPGFPKKPMHHLTAADLPRALERYRRLLDKLLQHEDGWVFAKPVDTHSLKLRDYLSIIAEPMDLGTVSRRLELCRYPNLLCFAKDVRRTFSNAMTYNNKGDDVYESAAKLSRIFESGWVSILAALPSPPPVTVHRARLKDELPWLPVDLQGKAVVIMKDIGGWIQEVDGRVEVDFDKADKATLDKLEWLLALAIIRKCRPLDSPSASPFGHGVIPGLSEWERGHVREG
ncbi:hypothetical protein CFC21_070002 [Triticum aestivum]|uniref:Bromo domain-containing protein n=3 Tax=Triticum TaxID=4564 RepID=A0A9R0WZI9_TRITD|nr:hypothetical protein CFC21_070002 [Triticum aestivum]VAI27298.1 unnamed protein product [Triticum turgidum subsp. durum]